MVDEPLDLSISETSAGQTETTSDPRHYYPMILTLVVYQVYLRPEQ
jgi:hypothetical protein